MPHSNNPVIDSPRARPARLPREVLALLFSLLILLVLQAAQARPAVSSRWATLSHTAFKHQTSPETTGGNVFVQDRSGFLWMGTQSGLVRWDGYRARHFTADPAVKHSLPDNYVLSLHLDPGGNLWVGTAAGGLARYDPASDRFAHYPFDAKGTGDPRIASLADDGAGGLWIGTATGLVRMSASGNFTRMAGAALPPTEVDSLLRDRAGQLWIGTSAGLWRQSGARFAPELAPLGADAPVIEALFEDSAGRIWVGTRNTGAFVIAAGALSGKPVQESGASATLAHERVTAITETVQGEVWLATEGAAGGIVALHPGRGSTRRIRHQPDVGDSLFDNDVYALYRDRSGIIFVASMMAMSLHDTQPNGVTTVRSAGPASSGAFSIPSLMVHPDGRVWVGVAGGGVDILDPERGLAGSIRPGLETGKGTLPQGRVLAMAAAPDGSVYIGTRLGLFHSDAGGRDVRPVNVPTRAARLPVFALAFAGDVLWMGGLDGLWGLRHAPGAKLSLLRHETASLGDAGVKSLYPTPAGDLWVGTRTGLARLDGAGRVEVVPTHPTELNRMAPGYLSSILMDKRGRMWFSSFGAGVVMLERTDGAGRRWFRRIGKGQGLRDNGVNALLEDEAGAIWASTDSGLARIDPDSLAVRLHGPAEGVHVNTYWTNAAARGDHGELLFGGLSGLTVLRPTAMAPWRYAAPLAVTRLVLGEREVAAGPYNAAAPATIEIAPALSERGFSLEFSALDFSAPERNRYSYRLSGFDAAWIDADAGARRIGYNNLKPGSYTLELRGSNRDGAWSAPLALPVRVHPAWHQRSWVHALAALLVLAMLAALVQARTAYLRRRQRELQDMVDTRTAQLRATQAQLELLAYADPLTGLPNRRMFNDDMRHLAAQAARGAGAFTLVLIDLDHFKQINDTLGHDAGDALLVAAAQRLQGSVREADRLFRLGGDEFAVLLDQTADTALIGLVCARVVAGLALPVPYGEVDMQISASVGAAPFHAGGMSLEELYKAADAALYSSKARGRNTWTLSRS